jgi:E3 ubiquitin-protein ligase HUWE1
MLFSLSNTEQVSYKVHEMSHEIIGCKDLFYFFGQLLGKSLFDKTPVCVSLNHQILYALIGKDGIEWNNCLESFEHIDKDVCNGLKFFRDNDLSQFEDAIEQYFVTNDSDGNEKQLVPNGHQIRVTNENKAEFIKLKCESIAVRWVQMQLK